MINTSLVSAAVLTVAIGVIHSWLGERRLIGPLLAAVGRRQGMLERSVFARQVLRFAWHLTTLAWWGFGALLVDLSLGTIDVRSRSILGIVAMTFLITGMAILVSSRGRHLAWPVFFLIAALTLAPTL